VRVVVWEAELVPVNGNMVIYIVLIMVHLVSSELKIRVHNWP